MGFLSKLFGDSSQEVHFENPGTFSVEVVGESRYQRELESICGGKTEQGHNLIVHARLVHDNHNPYDDQAIRVEINGLTVGYLKRNHARQIRVGLAESGYAGFDATCVAMIVGGWQRGPDDSGYFGVELDLPTNENTESTARTDPVIDRHYELRESIREQYKRREVGPNELQKAIDFCKEQISISIEVAEAHRNAYPNADLPTHTGYKQLAIIYEKQKKFEESIELCAEAKYRGWAGDWDKRIDRCTKKLKTTVTKTKPLPPSTSPPGFISLTCPTCGRQLNIPDKYSGTRGRCNHCGGGVEVP